MSEPDAAAAVPATGVRILILCAAVGEGHVSAARALAAALQRRGDVAAVSLRTDLAVLGRRFGAFMEQGFRIHLDGAGGPAHRLQDLSYELGYRLFFERPRPRRAAQLALAALASGGLRTTIREFAPDVVVTEFPVLSAALGQLRALGRLSAPVCSAISDPAGLFYWAHPGIDLHLLSWPQALAEAERIAGPGRSAVVVPLVGPRFLAGLSHADARARLGIGEASPMILVSGGGWGVGDLEGAVEVVRRTRPDALVQCLAGRSAPTAERLRARFAADPRVQVLGFTESMPELLNAADLLIHTTGGTTALEAMVVGCPLINFDTSVAHVRAHARALAARGVAAWARDRAELGPAVEAALARARPPARDLRGLPDAADLIVALAQLGPRR